MFPSTNSVFAAPRHKLNRKVSASWSALPRRARRDSSTLRTRLTWSGLFSCHVYIIPFLLQKICTVYTITNYQNDLESLLASWFALLLCLFHAYVCYFDHLWPPFQGLIDFIFWCSEFQKIEKLKPGQEATVSSSFLAAAMLLENLNCGLSGPREFSLCAYLLVYAGTGYI